jgi:hypothetical protein
MMNIFIGRNLSGKSSIIGALLGIRALSINRNYLPKPFKDFKWLHRRGTDGLMSVELVGSEGQILIQEQEIAVRPRLNVRFTESGTFLYVFTTDTIPEDIGITEISVSNPNRQDITNEVNQLGLFDDLIETLKEKMERGLEMSRPNSGYSFLVSSDNKDITHARGGQSLLGFSFTDITRDYTPFEHYHLTQRKWFYKYFSEMVYVSVQRGFLESDYPLNDNLLRTLTGDTVSPEEILNIQAYEDHRDQEATVIMKDWAEKFGIIQFETKIQPGRRIEGRGWIQSRKEEELLPVCFYGYGSNQFLIIIGKCIFAPEGAPILIEEPEIHLHPEMQALATDFLIEQMKEGHQLFITTHSEHMIGRIQRRIAEKVISPEDVGVYWVKYDSDSGTSVEEVKIDNKGVLHEELKTYMNFLQKEIAATRAARQQGQEDEGH